MINKQKHFCSAKIVRNIVQNKTAVIHWTKQMQNCLFTLLGKPERNWLGLSVGLQCTSLSLKTSVSHPRMDCGISRKHSRQPLLLLKALRSTLPCISISLSSGLDVFLRQSKKFVSRRLSANVCLINLSVGFRTVLWKSFSPFFRIIYSQNNLNRKVHY